MANEKKWQEPNEKKVIKLRKTPIEEIPVAEYDPPVWRQGLRDGAEA